jgi:predicted MFS family arabinose efflux permease
VSTEAFRDGAPAHHPPGGRSWFITGLGIGQICSWGSLYYSFPLIAEAMERDLGWSKPALYGAASLGLALSGLAAYPVGAAIDRGRGRRVMALGSVAAGLLLLAWSQIADLLLFYAIVAGIGCLQAATLYEPAFAVVARRSGASRARDTITALTLWGGFASTVFIPLVQVAIDSLGWRGALAVLGAINLLVCSGLYAAVIDPKADAPSPPRPADAPAPLAGRSAVAWAMRRPTFWALAVAFTAYAGTFSAFTFHFYPIVLERGFAPAEVVAAMAIIGPSQVAGRIAIWVIAPRASVRLIGSLVVAAFPLALLMLEALPPSFALVAFVAGLYGAANGILTIVRGLAVPEMLTGEAYGAVNGALAAPTSVARALAPAGAAALWAAAGSYDAVLVAAIAGASIFAAGFWTAAVLSRLERPRF